MGNNSPSKDTEVLLLFEVGTTRRLLNFFSGRDQSAGVAVTYHSHTDRALREINIPGHKFQGTQTFLMREPEKPVGRRTQINLFRFCTVSHSKVGFRAALVLGMWLRPPLSKSCHFWTERLTLGGSLAPCHRRHRFDRGSS